MKITDQVLGVVGYGEDTEDVIFCADGIEEAKDFCEDFKRTGTITLCRVRIIEVVE